MVPNINWLQSGGPQIWFLCFILHKRRWAASRHLSGCRTSTLISIMVGRRGEERRVRGGGRGGEEEERQGARGEREGDRRREGRSGGEGWRGEGGERRGEGRQGVEESGGEESCNPCVAHIGFASSC